jgi:hypothetical protein
VTRAGSNVVVGAVDAEKDADAFAEATADAPRDDVDGAALVVAAADGEAAGLVVNCVLADAAGKGVAAD